MKKAVPGYINLQEFYSNRQHTVFKARCLQSKQTVRILFAHKPVPEGTVAIERFTAATKKATKLPIIAKMTPNITDMCVPALAAKRGGADAISAINTLKGISQIDVQTFKPQPNISGKSSISGFSGPAVKPIALRFIAEMAKHKELKLPLSGIGGITTWIDGVEFLF